jgi:hypothetical protein
MEILDPARSGQVDFLHDGEAYTRRGLIVEHGNRYDGWNAVAFGVLRAYRSALSRSETPSFEFPPPPGSRLVAELMNPLKQQYRFVDLMKPENEAAIPILMALDHRVLRTLAMIVRGLPYLARAKMVDPHAGGVPSSAMYIAENQQQADRSIRDEDLSPVIGGLIDPETIARSNKLLEQARADWSEPYAADDSMLIADSESRGSAGLRESWLRLPWQHDRIAKLRKTLLRYHEAIGTTFDLKSETAIYLDAAKRLAQGGRFVVFGHTHLAKRIALDRGGKYLNTGTWCRTIQLDSRFFDRVEPDERVLPRFRAFVNDLAENRIEPWSRLNAYCAKMTFEHDTLASGDLFECGEDGSIQKIE